MPYSTTMLEGGRGLALVFVIVLLAQVGLPIPAAPVLLLAGAVAVRSPTWGAAAFLLAITACMLGDTGWYLAGRAQGNRILRRMCKMTLSPDSCVSETHRRFGRWGRKTLVIAKFLPGVSMLAPPLAGALRMKGTEFLTLTLAAASLWSGSYLVLGVFAAPAILPMLPWAARQGRMAALVIVLLLTGYVLFKWLQRRRLIAALRGARIEVAELQAMRDSGETPVILDVRTQSARALDPRVIPASLHVPPEEASSRLAAVGREQDIVIYCNCPNEASAAHVAKLLMKQGFKRVRPLKGGLDAWVEAGYAFERIAVEEVVIAETATPAATSTR